MSLDTVNKMFQNLNLSCFCRKQSFIMINLFTFLCRNHRIIETNKIFCEMVYINGSRLNKFIICKMDSEPAGDLLRQNMTSQLPCLFPINSQTYKKLDRLQTFKAPNIWLHHILATLNELEDVGFFYLGENDRVKCFYCNGGLRNWKSDERSWEEHAKWFSLCKYVLQRQGVDYVI